MHEFSLIADLFKKVETVVLDNEAERASKITIQLGALAHISPGHLKEHIDQASPGTPLEGADIEINLTDEDHPQAQEIVLESLEVE